MSDLAIWMAGHVSVPLYPTLAAGHHAPDPEHSEAKPAFIGKLDGWEGMKPGVPAGLPCISYPLAPDRRAQGLPGWDDIVRAHPSRWPASRCAPADELATIIYTSGTTGAPKGVMHSFGNFAWALMSGLKPHPMGKTTACCLPAAGPRGRAHAGRAWLAAHRHARVLCRELDTFTADMQRARPTIFFSVPRLWVKFQQGVTPRCRRPSSTAC
jgi:long-chain acyl-CoA synthetase